MASEVSICNQAISWLGGHRIISLDDGTSEANFCKDNFPELRDSLLEEYEWSFATYREKWPKAGTDPTFKFANKFKIPDYALRVLEVTTGDGSITTFNWQKEGQYIVTDEGSPEFRFIRQIKNVAHMSPGFRQALAARLAADMALPLTSRRQVQTDMYNLFQAKLLEAVSSDSMQGKSKRIRSDWLKRAR